MSSFRSALTPAYLPSGFAALHWVRVIAIFVIVQSHVTNLFALFGAGFPHAFVDLSGRGWFAMDAFFVMSGYLVGGLALSYLDDATGIGRFWLRRAFRTFPAYYVVLTAVVLTPPFVKLRYAPIYEYFYLTNYMPAGAAPRAGWCWSLAVEEHFYLAIPLLVWLLGRVKGHAGRLSVLGVLWVTPLFLRLHHVFTFPRETGPEFHFAVYGKTHMRFDILLAGVVLAYVHRFFPQVIERWSKERVLLGSVSVLGLCLAWTLPDSRFGATLAWGTVTSIAYVALLTLLVGGPQARSRVARRPILLLATLGYGIYLVQIPVGLILVKMTIPLIWQGTPRPVVWLLTLALTVLGSTALAWLLHMIVEKPMLHLRERLVPARVVGPSAAPRNGRD